MQKIQIFIKHPFVIATAAIPISKVTARFASCMKDLLKHLNMVKKI